MYQNIITPEEVIALAFSDGEYINPAVITNLDIAVVIKRWIIPITGEALLKAIMLGKYKDFTEKILKPTIAAYVRLDMQPRLNASTGQLGLSVVAGANNKAADEKTRHELMTSLRHRAKCLRKYMLEYLENNSGLREYTGKENVLNRCSCDGGIVQIL